MCVVADKQTGGSTGKRSFICSDNHGPPCFQPFGKCQQRVTSASCPGTRWQEALAVNGEASAVGIRPPGTLAATVWPSASRSNQPTASTQIHPCPHLSTVLSEPCIPQTFNPAVTSLPCHCCSCFGGFLAPSLVAVAAVICIFALCALHGRDASASPAETSLGYCHLTGSSAEGCFFPPPLSLTESRSFSSTLARIRECLLKAFLIVRNSIQVLKLQTHTHTHSQALSALSCFYSVSTIIYLSIVFSLLRQFYF